MANTYTTNLNLAKPEAGDVDWDDELNGNFDILDSMFVPEVPTGDINGSNKVFTLSVTPWFIFLFKNGMFMRPGGEDYALSGDTFTYEDNQVPQTGDVHFAISIKPGT